MLSVEKNKNFEYKKIKYKKNCFCASVFRKKEKFEFNLWSSLYKTAAVETMRITFEIILNTWCWIITEVDASEIVAASKRVKLITIGKITLFD